MHLLYDYLDSGNGYKVRLVMRLLAIPYRLVSIDILRGESRTPEFLAKNPNGRIPVLEFPDGRVLCESNAIMFHLAEHSELVPRDPFQRAQVLQWLFFEQYSHEPNVATVRFWMRHTEIGEDKRSALEQKRQQGHAALAVMERQLGQHSYLVADQFSIADIALYAYTHVAHEGGFDLAAYPAVRAWLARCKLRPNWAELPEG